NRGERQTRDGEKEERQRAVGVGRRVAARVDEGESRVGEQRQVGAEARQGKQRARAPSAASREAGRLQRDRGEERALVESDVSREYRRGEAERGREDGDSRVAQAEANAVDEGDDGELAG